MILDYAKNQVALLIGGSTTTIPSYMMIGSGSGTSTASMTTLIYPLNRNAVTSTDATTTYNVIYTGDWNSVQMSGLFLTEYGLTISGTGLTGSMWSRTDLPSITFDGTNELRIQETWEVF